MCKTNHFIFHYSNYTQKILYLCINLYILTLKAMKRFLAILIGATSCSLCTYAQNGYIVTTTSQQTSISVESLEKQFINDHFKYYNLCDWTPA